MKIFYFGLFMILFSCSKNVEDRCFTNNNENKFESYVEVKPFTAKQVFDAKPNYLQVINLKNFRTFKNDSLDSHFYNYNDEELTKKYYKHKEDYKYFDGKFLGQFEFSFKQKVGNIQYALGRNGLGYWLLKIENEKPTAYFLGLSFSHYYFNKVQSYPIIKDGLFQIEGSLVQIIKVAGLPGYDDYSAIADGKLFKIKLTDVEKDSDKDGYNDIFEESFALNPDNSDTDGDGVNDYDDMNPLFKSEKNKFTQLYEQLIPKNFAFDASKMKQMHYFFTVYRDDCDYFHKINPELRVLFVPEDKAKRTNYLKNTDVYGGDFSKIRKNKDNPNQFYITESSNSGSIDYAVEFKNAKWIIRNIGGIVI